MNNKLRITIRILAVIVIILSLYYIIMTNAQYKKAENEYTDLNTYTENTEVSDVITVDYDSLKKINGDFIGWLYACDGNISYPIVQSHDNEEYLKRTFNGSRNIAGCIFADQRTEGNYQTIIYGHSMNDGSMFRRLVDYKNAEYCSRYPYFYIYTPEGRRKYEIFSVYKKSPENAVFAYEDKPYERPELVRKIEESSMYKISAPDNIISGEGAVVSLVTCDVSNDYYRIIVNGKRVE